MEQCGVVCGRVTAGWGCVRAGVRVQSTKPEKTALLCASQCMHKGRESVCVHTLESLQLTPTLDITLELTAPHTTSTLRFPFFPSLPP
jgi:hypothetical protein